MNPNFVVMIVTLIIWVGLFLYLFSLDRKVTRLEKKSES
ncbi:MAG: CcmD family protein [Candidatus Zixiibacteriota bacterium]|nr:MAG: CcmD family protein [candidate division Zixibacteria bacterium]HHI03585.1 CcmD family protein [candidate division Zixibacteria bacterium]